MKRTRRTASVLASFVIGLHLAGPATALQQGAPWWTLCDSLEGRRDAERPPVAVSLRAKHQYLAIPTADSLSLAPIALTIPGCGVYRETLAAWVDDSADPNVLFALTSEKTAGLHAFGALLEESSCSRIWPSTTIVRCAVGSAR